MWLQGVWFADEGSITVPLRGGFTDDIKSTVLFILSDTAKSESGDLRNIADISWNIGDVSEVVAVAHGQPQGKSRGEVSAKSHRSRFAARISTLFLTILVPKPLSISYTSNNKSRLLDFLF